MMPGTKPRRDVFIVFSKDEAMGARFAVAVKDGLARLGCFAYEYEEWSWVGEEPNTAAEEAEVDRTTLTQMLEESSAILVIPPQSGVPSDGVAIELELLARMQLPVVLLRWPLPHAQSDYDELNVVYRFDVHGATPSTRWVSSAGEILADLTYFASAVSRLGNRHGSIGNGVFDALPAFGNQPLTRFSLRRGNADPGAFGREPDLEDLAARIIGVATERELRALVEQWWAEAEPTLGYVERDGYGPVCRPSGALRRAVHAVVECARRRYPALDRLGADALLRAGIALMRFGKPDDAVTTFSEALRTSERRDHSRIYLARAHARELMRKPELALADLDEAVAIAVDAYDEAVCRFARAVLRAKTDTELIPGAIDDYTYVLEAHIDSRTKLRALNYRAMMHAKLGDLDAALEDWGRVIERYETAPKAASQARLNRAGRLRELGRLHEARNDLTAVLSWADASAHQRFRAYECRAKVLEELGDSVAAIEDIEALLATDMVDPQWRLELNEKMAALRRAT